MPLMRKLSGGWRRLSDLSGGFCELGAAPFAVLRVRFFAVSLVCPDFHGTLSALPLHQIIPQSVPLPHRFLPVTMQPSHEKRAGRSLPKLVASTATWAFREYTPFSAIPQRQNCLFCGLRASVWPMKRNKAVLKKTVEDTLSRNGKTAFVFGLGLSGRQMERNEAALKKTFEDTPSRSAKTVLLCGSWVPRRWNTPKWCWRCPASKIPSDPTPALHRAALCMRLGYKISRSLRKKIFAKRQLCPLTRLHSVYIT